MAKFKAVLLGADSYPDQEIIRQFKANMPAANWAWEVCTYPISDGATRDRIDLIEAVMKATVVVAYAKDKEQALDWLAIQEATGRGIILHLWGLSREELAEQMS